MALSQGIDSLKSTSSCCGYSGESCSQFNILENDPAAILKSVTIDAGNGDWMCFDPDKGRGAPPIMTKLFKVGGAHGFHRACDCVFIESFRDGLRVVYFDLKSTNPSGYESQFKSTRQFVRYLVGVVNEFFGLNLQIRSEKFVILYGGISANKAISVKHRLQNLNSSSPSQPIKLMVGNGATVHLGHFVNG